MSNPQPEGATRWVRDKSLDPLPVFAEASVLRMSHQAAVELVQERGALLERAREEAAQIVGDAQAQAEQIRAAATQEGLDQSRQQVDEALRQTLGALAEQKEDYPGHVQAAAMAMARRILDVEFEVKPIRFRVLVHAALLQTQRMHPSRVRVGPRAHAAIKDTFDSLARELGLGDLVLQLDPDLHDDGVMIETSFGQIDASLKQQFDRLAEHLRGATS